jgi:protein-L-isoaspartate(D-aspartate) O-methyltransferase
MTETSAHTPDALHTTLVNHLRASGSLRTEPVRTAFERVPRHLFLPDQPIEDAYANEYVVTHWDADGAAVSSASQPSVVAMMLEQLAVEPGMRVLEIGAGTGYNAALLNELVGPAGQVVTIDIEPGVTTAAREHLAAAGHENVHVVTADGADGAPNEAPFDRVIATTGVWDIPTTWWEQLAKDGRMVIPLRWRGLTRSLALDYADGHLVARDVRLCGFIPMQGQEQEGEKAVTLADGVTLHFDEDTPVSDSLQAALHQPRTDAWSGVEVGGETSLEGVWMRLACTELGTGRMVTKAPALGTDLVQPAVPALDPVLIHEDSLAYLTARRLESGQPARFELGAIGHGPQGTQLAQRVCDQVRAWEHDQSAVPRITISSPASPAGELGGSIIIRKPRSRLHLSMP